MANDKPTFGSLFAGIGGFDLAFQRLEWLCRWQVEIDKFCNQLLEREWPRVRKYKDVRLLLQREPESVSLICGGDPCPTRSLAKGNRKSSHPDLAGYFLAVVGGLRPLWVVRENVRSPDVVHFAAGLEMLGYGIIAVELDARDFTYQSRRRQFVIGCPPGKSADLRKALLNASDDLGFSASSSQETTPIAACLTAHPNRLAAEDSYVYETCTDAILAQHSMSAGQEHGNYLYQGGRLRVLTPEECEGLQGFPRGWTSGFSRSRRRIMLGNAVNVKVAEWIGRRILEVMDGQGIFE